MANIPFREIWCVDFEFRGDPGENPWVVCMVACELNSGQKIQLWRDELLVLKKAPFDTGPDAVLVAYYSSAELGCFLELGWPLPVNAIDLFTEHRVETNGQKLPCGNGLLGALAVRGLAHIDVGEKEAMRRINGNGRRPNNARSWNTARLTSLAWLLYFPLWRQQSTGRARNCAGASWPRRPAWSGPVSRSTLRSIKDWWLTGSQLNGT